jgi:hypothetical protein
MQVMGKLRVPFLRSTKSYAYLIIGKATPHSSVGTLDSSFLFLSLSGTSFSSSSPTALEEIFREAGGGDGRDGNEAEAAMTPPGRAEEEAAMPSWAGRP